MVRPRGTAPKPEAQPALIQGPVTSNMWYLIYLAIAGSEKSVPEDELSMRVCEDTVPESSKL